MVNRSHPVLLRTISHMNKHTNRKSEACIDELINSDSGVRAGQRQGWDGLDESSGSRKRRRKRQLRRWPDCNSEVHLASAAAEIMWFPSLAASLQYNVAQGWYI
jgi:hypothetical protein